ncbi:hypothetical protein OIU79_011331 [Salix purpurea]|uniref:Uncharacterized protein n=1 Tax=Salix purpurea TaxID=77065 RepID=A0A9Q0Q135_SALPP|nr:hypothetical protein OIU79_011331 [Salix purpurea]
MAESVLFNIAEEIVLKLGLLAAWSKKYSKMYLSS